jgi:hypothetical protein
MFITSITTLFLIQQTFVGEHDLVLVINNFVSEQD